MRVSGELKNVGKISMLTKAVTGLGIRVPLKWRVRGSECDGVRWRMGALGREGSLRASGACDIEARAYNDVFQRIGLSGQGREGRHRFFFGKARCYRGGEDGSSTRRRKFLAWGGAGSRCVTLSGYLCAWLLGVRLSPCTWAEEDKRGGC